MSWVLVLTSLASYGFTMSSIPGYATEGDCVAAGQQWIERMNKTWELWRAAPRFVCIPGPDK